MPVPNARTQYRNKNPLPPQDRGTKGKSIYDRDMGFIFSDQLPVSKKRKIAENKKEFIVVDGKKV
jgi:hypothetical protein